MSGNGRLNLACTIVVLMANLLCASNGNAQIVRGAISGTVTDSTGAVVRSASVTATNTATNVSRTVQSDAAGFYRVGALDAGTYDVVVTMQGFATVENKGVVVRSATDTSVDVELSLAPLGETVSVTAVLTELPLNRSSATIGSTIPETMVESLPLPTGRDINNLILTMPNVSQTNGQGTYAINGQRPRNNNYMIDGSDNNDFSVTIATSQIVPETVAEFQVLQNPYSVEFGRNSGGQINVITKSGSNSLHGEGWDYYTPSSLYSLNNLEKASDLKKPARFVRHQAGADVGGPIVHDRLFFFGLYQGDSQRPGPTPGSTIRILTPAGYAAAQSVPLGAGQTAASRQAVLQRLSFLQDIYNLNPVFRNASTTLVNGVPIETAQANINIVNPSTYHTIFGRGDYHAPTTGDNITVRYSLNRRLDDNAISNCSLGAVFCGSQKLIDTNFAASDSHVFASNLLNEFRFSFVRRNLDFPENDPASPTASITGLFQIGGSSNFPQARITNAYQFSNTATWAAAPRHNLKFGTDIRYNTVDNRSDFNIKGTFTFNNLQDYLNNSAFRVQQALQTTSWNATQWQTFLWAQDDFRVTPDLTLNFGLRYELSEVPLDMFGATDPASLAALVPGPAKKDTNNWAPRVGFAWSPTSGGLFGDGRTVFRGGFGIGYDVIFYNLLVVNGSNYPRVVTLDQNNIQDLYPNKLTGSATPTFSPTASYANSPEDLQNPESRFYSISMQRELGGRYLVEVGYSGSRGYKGINQVLENPAILTPEQAALVASAQNANAIPGVQARRMFPQFGNRTRIPAYVGPGGNDVEARSTYNSVFVSTTRRMSRGLQFNVSYTYSRWFSNNDASLGESGTESASQRPQSMFDYEAEWGRSVYDRPHRFTASYLWQIPGPEGGILGHALGGWQLAGTTSWQSGRPFTILAGVDSSGDGNTGSDRPNINPAGRFNWDADHRNFTNDGYYVIPLGTNGLPLANSLGNGNAGRNTERMAGAWNTDLSFQKSFPIAATRLTIRADAFNILNQDNYGGAPETTIPSTFNNMSSPSFGSNQNDWGRRSFQLSAKVAF